MTLTLTLTKVIETIKLNHSPKSLETVSDLHIQLPFDELSFVSVEF